MSRILLLLIFLIWLTGWQATDWQPVELPWTASLPFLSFYFVMILVLGLWSRYLARTVPTEDLQQSLRRFNRVMLAARILIPAWFAVGVFVPQMGWAPVVRWGLDHLLSLPPDNASPPLRALLHLPGVLLGTLPPLLTWVGLIWVQFPADRALREQNLLLQLEADLPLHAPPRFIPYFWANFRLQVLFIVIPVLLIMLSHDVLLVAGIWAFKSKATIGFAATEAKLVSVRNTREWIDLAAQLLSALLVFLLAPEILRRVLHTEPLFASPIRSRLEALCKRQGMRYRDILLWRTQNNMCNAAVMGMTPRFRYVLLSDLLLQTMTDEQIEAVFAHEIGHVVHRHMAWYVVFFVLLMLTFMGPGQQMAALLEGWRVPEVWISVLGLAAFAACMLVGFGFLSRRCERQADVYAARTMQATRGPEAAEVPLKQPATAADLFTDGDAATVVPHAPPGSFVGRYGAELFASALHRVALINNIPVRASSWCHGSIGRRMDYIRALGDNPHLTSHFDRFMARLYGALLLLLLGVGTFFALQVFQGAH